MKQAKVLFDKYDKRIKYMRDNLYFYLGRADMEHITITRLDTCAELAIAYYGVNLFRIPYSEFTPSRLDTWVYVVARFVHSRIPITNALNGKI